MKHLAQVMAALCLVALATGSGPADAASGKSLKVGSSSQFQFGGNPSTGYRWRLDRGASTGLGLVRVQSLGYGGGSSKKKEGHVVVGAPAPFAFRVTCVKPGNANLRFTYVGPTGKSSSKREGVSVHCN